MAQVIDDQDEEDDSSSIIELEEAPAEFKQNDVSIEELAPPCQPLVPSPVNLEDIFICPENLTFFVP